MESTAEGSLVLRARNLDRAGFAHGFSLRAHDFGATASDEVRAENVRWLAEGLGFAPEDLRQVNQVHGARVVRAEAIRDAIGDMGAREEADAIVAEAESGAHALGVRVADCVPVLVGDRRIGAVTAIHAGWRGIVAGVIASAMRELARVGSGDYVAAVGPCIGACCFEVEADVAALIARAANEPRVALGHEVSPEKALVDLRRAVRAQLASAGVHDVEDVPGCTKCDAARFFSFRRDGQASGRHMAVIVARARAPISFSKLPI